MATSAPVRMLQCLFWPRKWNPCPDFAIFWCISSNCYSNLGQTLHISIQRYFLLLRARTFKPLGVNFLAHICFKIVRKNVQVQLMKLTLIYCQNSRNFSQKAHAHFCSNSFKTKNACNIHNSELACKKSASYDNFKLCLNTV